MSKKEVQDRQYTDEFKIEAVRLAESVGGNQAAKRLGMPESSLHNWVRLKRAGKLRALNGAAVPTKRPVSELEAENARLRRELASAKLDLEIVKNRLRARTSHMHRNRQLYTGAAHGQWPPAFWRLSSPSKNLAQGKLRTQLWWHNP